jgi:hypothetical protein
MQKEKKDKREQITAPLKEHESDKEQNERRPVDDLTECI